MLRRAVPLSFGWQIRRVLRIWSLRTVVELSRVLMCLLCATVERLVSRVEIADMLGVSKQRVHQLLAREDFPAPLADLGIGKVWERTAIEEWARRTGRAAGGDEGA